MLHVLVNAAADVAASTLDHVDPHTYSTLSRYHSLSMRLRLSHQLFLMIAATALLAALAVAVALSLNLGRGFGHYLDSRDEEQLQAFVEAAAASIAAQGGAEALREGRLTLTEVLRESAGSRDMMDMPPPMGESPPMGPDDWQRRAPGPRGPRAIPPDSFAARLLLFDMGNRQVLGPPPPTGDSSPPMLERTVRVGDEPLAMARLLPRGPTPDGVDARFLQSQYWSAAILVPAILLLAAIPAWWFGRRGSARFASMADVTRTIARGDFSARADDGGHDEISEMGGNINAMAESLAQLDGARRRWLAEISHELRTPLTALIGELDALRDGIRPTDPAAIQSLVDEAQRLSRIVQDLHFLAVSDLSGTSCQFAPTDAVLIVRQIAERFEKRLRLAGLLLEVDNGSLATLDVNWDRERIDQLLANLLTNSCRYTEAPGRVRIRLSVHQLHVHLTIEDSAPSVPADQLLRLFEPLYRDDSARARVTDGSGLGLAVCQAIVAAHGGTIKAIASALGGVSIQIALPLDSRPS